MSYIIILENNLILDFDSLRVSKILDSVASTFSISVRFDTLSDEQKKLLNPLRFTDVKIFKDGQKILTGYLVSMNKLSNSKANLLNIHGYSLAGFLEDCNISRKNYPLQFDGMSIEQIIQKITNPFNLKIHVDESVSVESRQRIVKFVAGPQETVKSIITKVCSQKNILVSHDLNGNLILFRPNIDAKEKAILNKRNCIDMSISVDGQGLFSDISVMRQPSKENSNLAMYDHMNFSNVKKYRPKTTVLTSGDEGSTKSALNNIFGLTLSAIKVTAVTDFDFGGLNCGDVVLIENDELMIKKSRFILQSFDEIADAEKTLYSYNFLVPETFSNDKTFKDIFI